VEVGARWDGPPNSLLRFRSAETGPVSYYEELGTLYREDARGARPVVRDVFSAYFLPVRGDPRSLQLELQVWTSNGSGDLDVATVAAYAGLTAPPRAAAAAAPLAEAEAPSP
jgi:hypothetical protein